MDEDKLRNQIPILRFLNKHKWRIILPILLFFPYWLIPFYTGKIGRPVQSYLFVTSTQNATPENLNKEVAKISDQVQSDEALLGFIEKYGLFSKEQKQGVPDSELIDKIRVSIVVNSDQPNLLAVKTCTSRLVYEAKLRKRQRLFPTK